MAARLRGRGHGADGQRRQNMPVKSRYCRNHAVTIVALEMMVPGSKIKGDRPRDGGIASVSHSFWNICMRDSHADGSLEMNIYSIYWACGPTLNRSPLRAHSAEKAADTFAGSSSFSLDATSRAASLRDPGDTPHRSRFVLSATHARPPNSPSCNAHAAPRRYMSVMNYATVMKKRNFA